MYLKLIIIISLVNLCLMGRVTPPHTINNKGECKYRQVSAIAVTYKLSMLHVFKITYFCMVMYRITINTIKIN
jgi:hypothetical protein